MLSLFLRYVYFQSSSNRFAYIKVSKNDSPCRQNRIILHSKLHLPTVNCFWPEHLIATHLDHGNLPFLWPHPHCAHIRTGPVPGTDPSLPYHKQFYFTFCIYVPHQNGYDNRYSYSYKIYQHIIKRNVHGYIKLKVFTNSSSFYLNYFGELIYILISLVHTIIMGFLY